MLFKDCSMESCEKICLTRGGISICPMSLSSNKKCLLTTKRFCNFETLLGADI